MEGFEVGAYLNGQEYSAPVPRNRPSHLHLLHNKPIIPVEANFAPKKLDIFLEQVLSMFPSLCVLQLIIQTTHVWDPFDINGDCSLDVKNSYYHICSRI